MSHKSNKSAKVTLKSAVGSENKEKNKHITKITANSSKTDKTAPATAKNTNRPATTVSTKNTGKAPEKALDAKTTNEIAKKSAKADAKKAKAAAKKAKKDHKSGEEKPLKEVFILARPFVTFGRYIRDSWREIRRVRWPNRKATWKMTGAVLAYCAAFMVFIVLLDSFFTWLFGLIIR